VNHTELLRQDIRYPAGGKDHAVLLLHGLSSTPQELSYLARSLAKQGYAVHAPYLPGYGLGTPCSNASQWRAQVRHCFDELQDKHARVSVGGLCIGATLALALAAEDTRVLALALLSVTLDYDGWTIPWYHWLLTLAYRTPLRNLYSLNEREPYGLKNQALRAKVARSMLLRGDSEIGAASLSMPHIYEARALARYVKGCLPKVQADCVLIHAIDDDVSSTANAEFVYARVGSPCKRKIFIDNCYHIITMDNERELVANETRWFFEDSAARHGSPQVR
jgi:carboxylesterase